MTFIEKAAQTFRDGAPEQINASRHTAMQSGAGLGPVTLRNTPW